MMTPTLKDLLDNAEMHANTVLVELKQRSLTPLYHLLAPEGRDDVLIPATWNNLAEKQAVVAGVTYIARQIGAVAVMLVAEAWMVEVAEGETAPDSPAASPNRIEVVAIDASDGNDSLSRTLRIIRDASGAIVELQRAPRDMRINSRLVDGIIPPKHLH